MSSASNLLSSANNVIVKAGGNAAITDTAGHRWTISTSGTVLEDAKTAGFTANVAELAYVNDAVWSENTAGDWYSWNGSTWLAGMDPVSIATPAPTPAAIPSPNDTFLLVGAASAITDAAGHRWTTSTSGIVLEDAKAAGFTANVAEIAYVNGAVWSENTAGNWYSWTGSAWTVGKDPLPIAAPMPTPSANDMVVLAGAASAITDAAGHRWTISTSDTVLEDAKAAGFTANVAEIAYVNGAVWCKNAAGSWYSWTGSAWAVGKDPLPTAAPPPTPSANDAVVLAGAASAITDAAAGHRWTISTGGTVLEDAKAAGFTANVAEIAYVNGAVWCKNTAGIWYSWTGSAWAASKDPLPTTVPVPTPTPTPSPNDTVVLAGAASAITDAAGHHWTISTSGIVLEDAKAAGFTANVAEMAYVNGTVWSENTASSWYSWTGTAWAAGKNPLPTAAPVPTPTPTPPTPPAPTPTPAASPNDTFLLVGGTSAITDAAGHHWTISTSGSVLEDAKAAAFTSNVAEIAYVNGAVWSENTTGNWYSWSGSGWNPGGDPLPPSGGSPGASTGVGSSLSLSGYHVTFDWEANDFPNSPVPTQGAFATTLSSGLRVLENGDQQYWTDSSTGQSPYALDNGVLDINATYVGAGNTPGGGSLSYDSGVFSTQGWFSQQYGYFEMRAEFPAGAGMWPQFWMLDNNSGQPGAWPPELDALEAFGAPNADGEGGTSQAHWNVHSQNTAQQIGAWATLNGNESTSYHTYGVLWTPQTLSFVYDGTVVAQAPTPSDYTQEMYMIVNLAVGGTWPGYATGENGTMKVDYLRAFSSDSAIPGVALQAISSPDGGGTSLYGASALAGGGASSTVAGLHVSIPAVSSQH